MPNHWNKDGDLVIEEKTLFRQVGWLTHYPSGAIFTAKKPSPETGLQGYSYSPVYIQIATWEEGVGWRD